MPTINFEPHKLKLAYLPLEQIATYNADTNKFLFTRMWFENYEVTNLFPLDFLILQFLNCLLTRVRKTRSILAKCS